MLGSMCQRSLRFWNIVSHQNLKHYGFVLQGAKNRSLCSARTCSNNTWEKDQSGEGIEDAVHPDVQNERVVSQSRGLAYRSRERKGKVHKKIHKRVLDPDEIASENQRLEDILVTQSKEDTFGIGPDFKDHKTDHKIHANYLDVEDRFENKYKKHVAAHIPGRTEATADASEEWHDVFGTLSTDADDRIWKLERQEASSFPGDKDEDDFDRPYRRLSSHGRRYTANHYGRKIEKLARKGKIAEAIDVLETEMLKEDRVMPNRYVFTTLIGCLGRVGYADKAFHLFNKMKKMGLQPENPTYTALFNAFANSPFKDKALTQTRHLRQLMAEKGYQPNALVYQAMMKAFGIRGDIQTAFGIVDEMIENGITPDEQSFRHLLMACISDREAGFKHAIEVWRRMRKKRMSPGSVSYNLLLRAARDCGAGDPEYANQLLGKFQAQLTSGQSPNQVQAPSDTKSFPSEIAHGDIMMLQEGQSNSPALRPSACTSDSENTSQEPWWKYQKSLLHLKTQPVTVGNEVHKTPLFSGMSVIDTLTPNILNPRVKFRELISLDNLDLVENRLALLGGASGFLSQMVHDDAPPDIRTFSLLLDCISSTRTAEADLLALMINHKVKPDIDFLSLLMRKRNLRRDFTGAKEIVPLISRYGLVPNMRTFGCMAMGCRNKEDGLQLLDDIDNMGMLPSVEVFNILMKQSYVNFDYKLALCKRMKTLEVRPDEITLHCIEAQIARTRHKIVDKEKGKPVPEVYQSEEFSKKFGKFMMYYKAWLLSMKVEIPPHPWDQFRLPVQDQSEQTENVSSVTASDK